MTRSLRLYYSVLQPLSEQIGYIEDKRDGTTEISQGGYDMNDGAEV